MNLVGKRKENGRGGAKIKYMTIRRVYKEQDTVSFSKRGSRVLVVLEGGILGTISNSLFMPVSKRVGWGAAALSQLHVRKTEPYFICSSLKVEIFTTLSCQIILSPKQIILILKQNQTSLLLHSHLPNHSSNGTPSMKPSQILSVQCSHNNMYFSIVQTILQLFPSLFQPAYKHLKSKACDLFEFVPPASSTGQEGWRMKSHQIPWTVPGRIIKINGF